MTDTSTWAFPSQSEPLPRSDISVTDCAGRTRTVPSPPWLQRPTRRRLGSLFVASLSLFLSAPASSAYFTNSLGPALSATSDCDDCFDEVALGPGQTIDYFGQTYDHLFVGSNGYVTFGSGSTEFGADLLEPRSAPPMIAVIWMDLDTRDDAGSNVFVNTSTPGQVVVTWDGSGRYSRNYATRTFAQVVVRSDQFVIPAGEGQLGFFYGDNENWNTASVGFSNGNPAVSDGDERLHFGPASELADTQRWAATPQANAQPAVGMVPEPDVPVALAVGLLAAALARARRRVRQ
jgi:hypothetical protein